MRNHYYFRRSMIQQLGSGDPEETLRPAMTSRTARSTFVPDTIRPRAREAPRKLGFASSRSRETKRLSSGPDVCKISASLRFWGCELASSLQRSHHSEPRMPNARGHAETEHARSSDAETSGRGGGGADCFKDFGQNLPATCGRRV